MPSAKRARASVEREHGERAGAPPEATALLETILAALAATKAQVDTPRARRDEVKDASVVDVVARLPSEKDVHLAAHAVAGACAAASFPTPRAVQEGLPADSVGLDFGAVCVRIDSSDPTRRYLSTRDSVVDLDVAGLAAAKMAMLREANRVFVDTRNASRWLRSRNRALGGRIPLSLMQTAEGLRAVEQELIRIDEGIFS